MQRSLRGKYSIYRHDVSDQPFFIDGVECRLIPLTNGQAATVEARRYDELTQWNWTARKDQYTGKWYALRTAYIEGHRFTEYMHRRLLGLDKDDKRQGDHVNPDETLLNIQSNLRVATSGQNLCNKHRPRNNTSGYKGVSFRPELRKFGAYITFNRHRIHLGFYATAELAFEARKRAAMELHREFARAA